MNLRDFQVMYGDLLMGAGSPYRIPPTNIALLDLPALRSSDTEIAHGDGVWPGDDYAHGQTLPLSLTLIGDAAYAPYEALRPLLTATTPRCARDLWFKLPHLEQSRCLKGVLARRRAVPLEDSLDNYVRVELDLFAPDPTRYGETQVVSTTGGGSVAGVNLGDKSTWPRIVVHGPLAEGQEVAVTDRDLGTTVAVSVPLTAGEQLVIDQQTGTALVDGWDDVGAWVTSRGWWSAQPSASFTADVTAPAGVRVDLEWEPAWW